MGSEPYVTNAAWTAGPGRPDAIDEIADQFEKPSGALAFWDDVTARRAARDSVLAPAAPVRRAG